MKTKVGATIPIHGVMIPLQAEGDISKAEMKEMRKWTVQDRKEFKKDMNRGLKQLKREYNQHDINYDEFKQEAKTMTKLLIKRTASQAKKSHKKVRRIAGKVRYSPKVQKRMREQRPFLYKLAKDRRRRKEE